MLFVLFLIYSCANVVSPTGGPRDTDPPVVKESNPGNYAVNFNDNKILISFNEFIQLKNASQKLIVSPPLAETPKLLVKGKTLSIQLNNELLENTTYTLNFLNSVADLNEGNAENNFQFVFSTGNYIDSFQIRGFISDAYTLEKQKDIFVLLYENLSDTAPIKEKPIYVTKTNEQGEFHLKYIKNGSFKIYALSDANNNLMFDLPNEKFAFYDSLIIPSFEYKMIVDSANIDSVRIDTSIVYKPDNIKMFLFSEDNKKQFLSGSSRPLKYKLNFLFNIPLIDSFFNFSISGINQSDDKAFINEISNNSDSLTVYITDSIIYNQDTLNCIINYLIKDSVDQLINHFDTLNLTVKSLVKKQKDIVRPDSILVHKINVLDGNIFDINKELTIEFYYPVENIDNDKIKLYEFTDSVKNPIEFSLIKDKNSRKYIFEYPFISEKKYRLDVLYGSFSDHYNHFNDSISVNFTMQKSDQYGKLILHIEKPQSSFFILLTDEKDVVLQTFYSDDIRKNKITIPYLKPGNYKIKAIIDTNGNKKWDSGNYLKKIQPEKVIKYHETINIRSNWDLELDWNINK